MQEKEEMVVCENCGWTGKSWPVYQDESYCPECLDLPPGSLVYEPSDEDMDFVRQQVGVIPKAN